ncbi:MAG: transposase [candidate division Zixibacteria bacterium]|nr:transposase [candidate division Zixibacteria bacterium]
MYRAGLSDAPVGAQVMYARTSAMVAKRFRAWKKRWQSIIPRAVNCLEKDFDKPACLADRLISVFDFPEEIRKMIRTTNVIERCFREVRRRPRLSGGQVKVMGYFQNSKSCDRIIRACRRTGTLCLLILTRNGNNPTK